MEQQRIARRPAANKGADRYHRAQRSCIRKRPFLHAAMRAPDSASSSVVLRSGTVPEDSQARRPRLGASAQRRSTEPGERQSVGRFVTTVRTAVSLPVR
jgi:hypothetical protein